MEELLRKLLDALDDVGETHQEIYDTVCRERMGDAIFQMFIKQNADYRLPDDFGLHTEDANLRTKEALASYIHKATDLAMRLGLVGFHARLAAFQNESIESTRLRNFYDDFFGSSNPADFDQDGNVIRT